MDAKKRCMNCGKCCLADMVSYVSGSDIERWEMEGRTDILEIIARRRAWAGDRIVNSTGTAISMCSFLEFRDGKFYCSIYETRPLTCRNFEPGSSPLCPQYGPG